MFLLIKHLFMISMRKSVFDASNGRKYILIKLIEEKYFLLFIFIIVVFVIEYFSNIRQLSKSIPSIFAPRRNPAQMLFDIDKQWRERKVKIEKET